MSGICGKIFSLQILKNLFYDDFRTQINDLEDKKVSAQRKIAHRYFSEKV